MQGGSSAVHRRRCIQPRLRQLTSLIQPSVGPMQGSTTPRGTSYARHKRADPAAGGMSVANRGGRVVQTARSELGYAFPASKTSPPNHGSGPAWLTPAHTPAPPPWSPFNGMVLNGLMIDAADTNAESMPPVPHPPRAVERPLPRSSHGSPRHPPAGGGRRGPPATYSYPFSAADSHPHAHPHAKANNMIPVGHASDLQSQWRNHLQDTAHDMGQPPLHPQIRETTYVSYAPPKEARSAPQTSRKPNAMTTSYMTKRMEPNLKERAEQYASAGGTLPSVAACVAPSYVAPSWGAMPAIDGPSAPGAGFCAKPSTRDHEMRQQVRWGPMAPRGAGKKAEQERDLRQQPSVPSAPPTSPQVDDGSGRKEVWGAAAVVSAPEPNSNGIGPGDADRAARLMPIVQETPPPLLTPHSTATLESVPRDEERRLGVAPSSPRQINIGSLPPLSARDLLQPSGYTTTHLAVGVAEANGLGRAGGGSGGFGGGAIGDGGFATDFRGCCRGGHYDAPRAPQAGAVAPSAPWAHDQDGSSAQGHRGVDPRRDSYEPPVRHRGVDPRRNSYAPPGADIRMAEMSRPRVVSGEMSPGRVTLSGELELRPKKEPTPAPPVRSQAPSSVGQPADWNPSNGLAAAPLHVVEAGAIAARAAADVAAPPPIFKPPSPTTPPDDAPPDAPPLTEAPAPPRSAPPLTEAPAPPRSAPPDADSRPPSLPSSSPRVSRQGSRATSRELPEWGAAEKKPVETNFSLVAPVVKDAPPASASQNDALTRPSPVDTGEGGSKSRYRPQRFPPSSSPGGSYNSGFNLRGALSDKGLGSWPKVKEDEEETPMLRPDQDVALVLTPQPSVATSKGLEAAVAEAKSLGAKNPSSTVSKLIDQAIERLEVVRTEVRRCAAMRDERWAAFKACEPIRDVVKQMSGMMHNEKAGGVRRAEFFDLHLSLTREGFFGKEKGGAHLTRYPYAYGPPPFVLYIKTLDSGGSFDFEGGDDDTPEPDPQALESAPIVDFGSDEGAGAPGVPLDLRIHDESPKLWKQLVRMGSARRGMLTFDGLLAVVFELADGALTHKYRDKFMVASGPSASSRTSTQEYLKVVVEIKNRIQAEVPEEEPEAPLSVGSASTEAPPSVKTPSSTPATPATPSSTSGASTAPPASPAKKSIFGGKKKNLLAALGNVVKEALPPGMEAPTSKLDGSAKAGSSTASTGAATASAPSTANTASASIFRGLTATMTLENIGKAQIPKTGPRLKHTWLNPQTELAEMSRRLNLLRNAVTASGGGVLNKEAVVNEFRSYCRIAGAGGGKKGPKTLSYVQIDKAWRRMEDRNYSDLTFRYEVVAREPVANGCRSVLLDASRKDAEQMGAFIKLLDQDCDGRISEADFVHSIGGRFRLLRVLERLDSKWHAAAVAIDKDNKHDALAGAADALGTVAE